MKNKIYVLLSLLLGLMFINAGLNKFFNYIPVPDDLPEQAMKLFMAMMQIPWLMPLLATFEILGGILVIIPRFRAFGAVILSPIMIGILAHHVTIGEGLLIPLLMTGIWLWIIFTNLSKYRPMFHHNHS